MVIFWKALGWTVSSIGGTLDAYRSAGAGTVSSTGGDRFDRRRRLYALMQLRQGGVR